ncbi:lea1 [Symbiodinium natans]|uniref:Mediator of RNA polymerase II transcription subunit 10 n=1 Tax=Symbiodinium natans TaxID=878477 RepID=A0A812RGW7_9DINO|nr:lea1 [Symbiodinium natans]
MSMDSARAETRAISAVSVDPCDRLQVSVQQLLRVITDVLDALEQGAADEALNQKLQKYVAVLAEVDQRAAALPETLEVPVALLQHMDQGGTPANWCQSLLDRLRSGMEGFKLRKAPAASLSRHLRARGWGLASLNSLSRPSSDATASGLAAASDNTAERKAGSKRPLESAEHGGGSSAKRLLEFVRLVCLPCHLRTASKPAGPLFGRESFLAARLT